MTKTGCPGFDTPYDRALAAPPMDVAQQIEISAAHEPRAGAHQSNCTTTQVVRFPGRSAGNTRFAKEDFSNLAIRCTGQVRVQSTKCKHELLTLQLREGIGRSNGALPGQKAPEALRRIGACSKIGVERIDRRGRRTNLQAAHEQESKATLSIADDPVLTVARVTPKNRRQRDKRART
jgi:hypothetical protein